MKIIHVKLARSIWLFDIMDLNPKGRDLLGDLVTWIKDAYNFAVAPDPDNPVPNTAPVVTPVPQTAPPQAPGGLLFQKGSFRVREEIYVAISALTVYNDGIVVDTTSSTDDADQFADDLLKSAASEFGLSYDAETVRRRLYLSELIVRSDLMLASLNPSLAAFTERLPNRLPEGSRQRFEVASIGFWSEPNDAGLHRVIRIERQLGKPFSEHRFYSEAPLQTRVHFEVLEDLERSVLGSSDQAEQANPAALS